MVRPSRRSQKLFDSTSSVLIDKPSVRFSKLWLGAFIFWSSHTVAAPKVMRGVQQSGDSVELIDGANYIATFNGKILPGLIGYSVARGGFAFDESGYLESDMSSDDVRKLKRIISHLDYRRCRKGCHLEVKSYRVVADRGARSIFIRDPHGDYLALHRSSRAIGTPWLARHAVSSGDVLPATDRGRLHAGILTTPSAGPIGHRDEPAVPLQRDARRSSAHAVGHDSPISSVASFIGVADPETGSQRSAPNPGVGLPVSRLADRRGITQPLLARVGAAHGKGSARYVATYNGRTLPGHVGYDAGKNGLLIDEDDYLDSGIPESDVEMLKQIVSQLDYKRCRDGCHLEVKSFRMVVDKGARSIFIRDARGDYVALHKSTGAVRKRALASRASPGEPRATNGNERVDKAPLPPGLDGSRREPIKVAVHPHGEPPVQRSEAVPAPGERLARSDASPFAAGEVPDEAPVEAPAAAIADVSTDRSPKSDAAEPAGRAGDPLARDDGMHREPAAPVRRSDGAVAGKVPVRDDGAAADEVARSGRDGHRPDYRRDREGCYPGVKNCRLMTHDGARPVSIRDSRGAYAVSRAAGKARDGAGEATAGLPDAVDGFRSMSGRRRVVAETVVPQVRDAQLVDRDSDVRDARSLPTRGIELDRQARSGSAEPSRLIEIAGAGAGVGADAGARRGQLADPDSRSPEPVPETSHENDPVEKAKPVLPEEGRPAVAKTRAPDSELADPGLHLHDGTQTLHESGAIDEATPASVDMARPDAAKPDTGALAQFGQAAEPHALPERASDPAPASADEPESVTAASAHAYPATFRAESESAAKSSMRADEGDAAATVTRGLKVSYGVPEGFSAAELDDSASYVSTFNGRTLPGLVSYSQTRGMLTFDEKAYLENGISREDIGALKQVFSHLNYKQCRKGCDVTIANYHVTVDKLARSIAVRDARNDYIAPPTGFGLVNNQTVDLRAATDGYRAFNVTGGTWVGMPSQSFGFLSWYVNETHSRQYSSSNRGLSSYYLQKNFASTYIRAGRQSSLDYSSNAVSTLISPSFDQFVTFGSQSHLDVNDKAGSLILYANADGNYEFYRDGRLVLKRPAAIGRNQISYADLPGGYYSIEVRLVDRNGNIVSREIHEINNLNFGGPNSGNAWHVTAGKDMYTGGYLVEGAMSRNLKQFYLNSSILVGQSGRWAAEINMTRPTRIAGFDIAPTLGVLSGERSFGGYANVSVSHDRFGSLTMSRYQNTNVSRFYRGQPSTALSYSRVIRKATFSYNYQQSNFGRSHQAEVRWNYRPNGLWATFALGLQKGGFQRGGNGYGVYFNMTVTLDRVQGSFGAAHSSGQTQLNADVRKDFQDNFGTSTVGFNANRTGNDYGVNVYGNRSGTRGDVSLNVGNTRAATNVDFNYRGTVAASKAGIALGRYSPSGTAMLLSTPKIGDMHYGFNVEGSPVAGNSRYAVPLNAYADVSFARVFSNSHDLDMNIEVPANIVRAHPGQVYSAKAKVDINMIYSGFLTDAAGKPLSGRIIETEDRVYRNGLFSIVSKKVLSNITIETDGGEQYRCDLKKAQGSYFRCERYQPIVNAKAGE
ncbi:TcfC E-set like domain-containing protein [Burkholderia plantarii]|uniref:TcfC E-set like domain-containing protein n=1 Tax=Burkholderia plantarii TaxID=41899 RepID=UPI001D03BC89|nr:TcfC E-set like domain-containing protein [Burkholderia plantarii]